MKLINKLFLACTLLLFINGCDNVDRFSILKKCTVLGDESIIYARAHYVKLFYHFNPDKFSDSYKQINGFDAVTHKNTIDTYNRAVEKLSANQNDIKDKTTQSLLSACKGLSSFSTNFVEKTYPKAITFNSQKDPLTDEFFIEINQFVKFDHNIGVYDKNMMSFKLQVDQYKKAVSNYIKNYRKSIPSEFVNSRVTK